MGEGIPWTVCGRYGGQGRRASTCSREREGERGVAGLEGDGSGVRTAARRRSLSGAEELRAASLACSVRGAEAGQCCDGAVCC